MPVNVNFSKCNPVSPVPVVEQCTAERSGAMARQLESVSNTRADRSLVACPTLTDMPGPAIFEIARYTPLENRPALKEVLTRLQVAYIGPQLALPQRIADAISRVHSIERFDDVLHMIHRELPPSLQSQPLMDLGASINRLPRSDALSAADSLLAPMRGYGDDALRSFAECLAQRVASARGRDDSQRLMYCLAEAQVRSGSRWIDAARTFNVTNDSLRISLQQVVGKSVGWNRIINGDDPQVVADELEIEDAFVRLALREAAEQGVRDISAGQWFDRVALREY